MSDPIDQQLAGLRDLSIDQLRSRYQEVFGEPPRSYHRHHLIRRIAWQRQMLCEGDLCQKARRRAEQLLGVADLRTSPRQTVTEVFATMAACRSRPTQDTQRHFPPPGSVLRRHYKGRTILVHVLERAFEWEGQTFRSLSAVAKAVSGSHCSGYRFFELRQKQRQA